MNMAKRFCALFVLSLSSCGGVPSTNSESSTKEETPSTSESSIEQESSSEPINYVDLFEGNKIAEPNPGENDPHISIEKDSFKNKEDIVVTTYNCESKDWVGIYPDGGYPGDMTSMEYTYANTDNGTVTLNASLYQNESKYHLYLCKNDGYVVLDHKVITITTNVDDDYKPQSAKYLYENGEIKIVITPSTTKSLTYEVYWAKNGKRLSDYSYFAKFKRSSTKEFTATAGSNLVMPDEANQIEVVVTNGQSTSLFVDASDEAKISGSNYLYSFNVYTDIHVRTYTDKPNHVEHLQNALNDAYNYNPNSKALFTVGDHTDRGYVEDYETVSGLLNTYKEKANVPVYYTLGNHEFIFASGFDPQVELFKKYAEVDDVFYTKEMEGSTCIFMGSDSFVGEGTINEEHIQWLKGELDKADKTKPIFIFLHQPLINTVAGSYEGQNWYGIVDTGEEIKELLAGYKNTFLFTGHTHWEMESKNNILISNTGTSYINCSAVGYLWNDNDVGEPGSEGYFVDVYDNCIVLRGREFVKHKWLGYATYRIPFAI